MIEDYSKKFYENYEKNKQYTAELVLDFFIKTFNSKSIIDFGCGTGIWLAVAENKVDKVLGIDGDYIDKNMLQISEKDFLTFDLEYIDDLEIHEHFDLAISLEVAEHISRDKAETFCRKIMEVSDVIIFSAAIPGQGGVHHVNEQWPHFWQSIFEKYGYSCIDCVRDILWNDEYIPTYYKQNMLCFVNSEIMDRGGAQLLQNQVKCGSRLDCVHPEQFTRVQKNYEVLCKMMQVSKDMVKNWFESQELHSIALYGAGRIGEYFYRLLLESGYKCSIPYVFDEERTKDFFGKKIIAFGNEVIEPKVDLIIVTAVYDGNRIISMLNNYRGIYARTIGDVLECIIQFEDGRE